MGDVLRLRGDGNAYLMGALTQNSDARLKQDIEKIARPLQSIIRLNGYTYHWKDDNKDPKLQAGVLAQEVKAVLPHLVSTDDNGTKSVNYNGLVPYLLESIKELKNELEQIKQQMRDRQN